MANVRTYVAIRYDCIRSARRVEFVGTEQSLLVEVSQFNPPTLRVEKSRRYSRGGQRFASVIAARYREGRIEVPWIEPADVPQWVEFFRSVDGDEPFTISAPGITGVNATFDVFIPDDAMQVTRRGILKAFQTGFNYRVLEDL